MAKPATTRPRARPADSARRREILAAATEVFAEKGIVAATVRDIGDRAGILSGSLYHHFSSKEAMVAEILVPVVRSQVEAFDAISDATDDPAEVVRRLIAAAVVQTAANPHAARILRHDSQHFAEMTGLDEVVEQQRAVLSRWTSTVKAGIAGGAFRREVDPIVASGLIADEVLGAYRWMKPIGTLDPDQVAGQLAGLVLQGLEPD